MSVKDHFLRLNKKFNETVESSFSSDHEAGLSELFQVVDDLKLWQSLLDVRADTTILVSSIREYEFGFQAAVCGQYRYAFVAQRYFIEQIARFIYLSTNELHLRHWKLGLRDIAWGEVTDKEKGIFSKIFIRAFYDEVEDEGKHFLSIASKLYRESSEFVHGNFNKLSSIPEQITYDSDMLGKWLKYMETGKLIALFLLFMRFSKDLERKDALKLEQMWRDELCSIDGFSNFFRWFR